MNPEPSRSLETLLTQSDWVTALARSLCGDRETADDVVQAAWLDAMRAPPPDLRDPRAWLTTVVRRQLHKLRRSAQRRQRHERAATDHGHAATAPAADELAQRLQTHRELVDAVLALDEPYRATIVLRFFEHLEVDAIAQRTGSPPNTVRSRLQRALQQLRDRLDRAPGGRERWLPAVLVLAKRPLASEAVAAGTTGTAVATGIALAIPMKKFVITAAALAASLFLLLPLWSPAPDGKPRTTGAGNAVAATAAPTARTAADPGAAPIQRELAPTPPTPLATRGRRLVDRDGNALVDVVLRAESPFAVRWQGGDRGWISGDDRSLFISASDEERLQKDPAFARQFFGSCAHPDEWRATILGEPLPARETRSGPDGSFTFAAELAASDATITVTDKRYVLIARGATDGAPWRAGPAARVQGRVVDETDQPLADAFLLTMTPLDGGTALPEDLETRTDDAGRFLVRRALVGGLLRVARTGYMTAWLAIGEGSEQQLTIVMQRRPAAEQRSVDGLVVDAGGRPIDGASVWFGRKRGKTGPDGRFRLDANEPQPQYALTVAAKGYALLQRDDFGATVAANAAAGADVLLVLDRTPLQQRGVVFGIDGAPLAGARVGLVDPTLLDITFTSVEAMLGGFEGGVTTAADGTFALPGLSDRSYRLRAIDPRTGANATSPPWRAGTGDVVLRLADTVRTDVRGSVREAGTPLANATVEISFCTHITKGGGNAFDATAKVACDGDGSFVLPVLPRRAAWLVVRTGDEVKAKVPVESLGDGELVLDCGAPRWLQLVGSAHGNARSVHFVFADDRVEPARIGGAPALLGADGDIAPLLLPTGAIAVAIEHGTANERRLELTDDVAVHLRVR